MIEETLDDEDVIEMVSLAHEPKVIVDLDFDDAITLVRPPPPNWLTSPSQNR